MEGAILKWALTTHGANFLILVVAFYIMREKLDARYQSKDNCPDDKCYDVFLTKDAHTEKEKRIDLIVDSMKADVKDIKDGMQSIQLGVTKQVDRMIDFFKAVGK